MAASAPESCVMPPCSVDEAVATWPTGPRSLYCLEVLPCSGLQTTLYVLLVSSVKVSWWGKLGYWA